MEEESVFRRAVREKAKKGEQIAAMMIKSFFVHLYVYIYFFIFFFPLRFSFAFFFFSPSSLTVEDKRLSSLVTKNVPFGHLLLLFFLFLSFFS